MLSQRPYMDSITQNTGDYTMKIKIEMYIEISKDDVEDYEVKSHIHDALTMYTGNDIEFWNCDIEKIIIPLNKFKNRTYTLICIENFVATHTNYINGKKVTNQHEFKKGSHCLATAWRPEGMEIDGFFVFNKNANKFAEY